MPETVWGDYLNQLVCVRTVEGETLRGTVAAIDAQMNLCLQVEDEEMPVRVIRGDNVCFVALEN